MPQALYRKYRSKSLTEIVGQDHITGLLARALKNGKIAHAYLLTGPRGVGKTSIARILAHEINQLPYTEESNHLDIIEIDAASNNGVEDVRDLREKVQIAPVSASKKVYIIDEVHMLSKPAFNALLKTLEEPPEHVVFILATTDVEKLPATIISRTQRFGFRAIRRDDAVLQLKHIAKEEAIVIDDDALALIAERGDGSFRDSISLLDQLSSLTDEKTGITVELIEASLGLAPVTTVQSILEAVAKHDVTAVAKLLDMSEKDGISPTVLNEQLVQSVRTRAVTHPELLGLLDKLLDVPKSTQPASKLLTVLGLAAIEHKPAKVAALATPVLEVSASLDELAKQATKKHPKMEAAKVTVAATAAEPVKTASPVVTPTPAPAPTITVTVAPTAPAASKPETTTVTATVSAEVEGSDVTAVLKTLKEFEWSALINYASEHYLALFSVLSRCSYELSDDALTIYTNNAFSKKKMDDAKHSLSLHDCLKALGHVNVNVITIPTGAPLKDSQAAAIAAMMGGGTEVSLEATK